MPTTINPSDQTLTQHDVLVGGASNTVTSVSPSTAGFVLTSNGTSADPSFQDISAAGAIKTINGDSGSVTGSTVTFNAASQAGASVSFSGASTTMSLNLTTANGSTFLGLGAGKSTAGIFNTGVGNRALNALNGGLDNCAIGVDSSLNITTGGNNISIGVSALSNLTGGSDNIAIGPGSGSTYNGTESGNIMIGQALGTLAESNVTRIGFDSANASIQTACYIDGIAGKTVSNQNLVTVNTSTGQLGAMTYTEGTFTPTMVGNSTAGTTTYTVQQGYYIRIGNIVTIWADIEGSAATGTGTAKFGGFPFTVKNQANYTPQGSITSESSATWAWPAGSTMLTMTGTANSTNGFITTSGTASTGGFLQMANAAFSFQYTLTYQI